MYRVHSETATKVQQPGNSGKPLGRVPENSYHHGKFWLGIKAESNRRKCRHIGLRTQNTPRSNQAPQG